MDPTPSPTPPAFGSGPPPPPPAPPAPPATPPAPPMAEGGQTQSSTDVGQWVAIVLISLTLVNLVLQISLNRKQHAQIGKTDDQIKRDIKELKLNVQKSMGDKYEPVTV